MATGFQLIARGMLADPASTGSAEACCCTLGGMTRPLIGYLFHCLRSGARPGSGPGARAVALTSAAYRARCGSHLACAVPGVAQGRGEAQEGFARLEVALPSRLDDQ